MRVLPRTSTIAVVLGATPLERFWRGEVERETAYLADQGVAFVWFDGLSLAQMAARVDAAVRAAGAAGVVQKSSLAADLPAAVEAVLACWQLTPAPGAP